MAVRGAGAMADTGVVVGQVGQERRWQPSACHTTPGGGPPPRPRPHASGSFDVIVPTHVGFISAFRLSCPFSPVWLAKRPFRRFAKKQFRNKSAPDGWEQCVSWSLHSGGGGRQENAWRRCKDAQNAMRTFFGKIMCPL